MKIMKVTRLGSEKNLDKDVDCIVISVDDKEYTITEEFGEIRIHAHSKYLIVKPGSTNEIKINSEGW